MIIFGKDYCIKSNKAKQILDDAGVKYKEIDIDLLLNGNDLHLALIKHSG